MENNPDAISEAELDKLLLELRGMALNVDHRVCRAVINDAFGELGNEIDNIKQGFRKEGLDFSEK